MHRFIYLLLTLFLSPAGISAQIAPVYAIDAHADTLKHADFPDLHELTGKLTEPAQNELEKVRAIFYWIAKNIRYDYEGLQTHAWERIPLGRTLALTTYDRGTGICGGYAMLMSTMLDHAGINNAVVTGYAKGDDDLLMTDSSLNHAWNAVQIDSVWHLLDVTWASPIFREDDVREFFFLTPPGQLIATHFPTDEKWTLLDRKISREMFDRIPQVNSLFYELGFGASPPVVEQTPGKLRFNLHMPEQMIIGFILYNKATSELTDAPFHLEKGAGDSTVTVDVPQEGDYSVEMTAMWDKYPYRKYFGVVVVEVGR